MHTRKCVTEVTVAQNEIYKPTIQHEKKQISYSVKELFRVLSLVASVPSQPSAPLIDVLVDDVVLQFSLMEMRRCTEYHIYSVQLLLAN